MAHYNFCRVHETLRTTPAVALGVADRVWSVGELIEAAMSMAAEVEQPPAPPAAIAAVPVPSPPVAPCAPVPSPPVAPCAPSGPEEAPLQLGLSTEAAGVVEAADAISPEGQQPDFLDDRGMAAKLGIPVRQLRAWHRSDPGIFFLTIRLPWDGTTRRGRGIFKYQWPVAEVVHYWKVGRLGDEELLRGRGRVEGLVEAYEEEIRRRELDDETGEFKALLPAQPVGELIEVAKGGPMADRASVHGS